MLLSFVLGVAVQSFISIPVLIVWIGFLIAFCLIAFWSVKRNRNFLICGLCAAAFVGGALRLAYGQNTQPDLSPWYGEDLTIEGFAERDPEQTAKIQRVFVRVTDVEDKPLDRRFSVLATLEKYPEYRLGDKLKIHGTLDQPENFTEDFDYVSYLARDGIFATLFFPKTEKIGERKGSLFLRTLSGIKHAFEQNIDAVLAEPHSSFLKGLLLGERESLPADLVENFKRTGTTHIIALSGYNITLVGRFFMNLLLGLTIPFYTANWIAVASIFFFILLTGAHASVVRAGIMGILVLLAQREGRMYHMTNALAFAGAVMIFQNPFILRFDAAFQLSFLATAGLVYLSPHVERRVDRAHDAIKRIWHRAMGQEKTRSSLFDPTDAHRLFPFRRILAETLAAQLAVLPSLIYLFGQISLVSPLTNVLILIAVPFSMGVGFLAGFLGFLWRPASQVSAWLAWGLLEYKIRVIEFFAQFPFALVPFPHIDLFTIFIVYGLMAFFLVIHIKKRKIRRS